ncbi:MAG: SMC-Scp complex subunit ScpB, partial [Pseudomonadota bacterium]
QHFLDHFGLESARDLPDIKELRTAGLLDNRPPPGVVAEGDEDPEDQDDMFE